MFAGSADNVKREKAHEVVGGLHAQSNGCVVCGSGQNGDNILLCDGCDGEYHTYCLVPPLTEIPVGDFYCTKCMDTNVATQHKSAADAIVADQVTAAAAPNTPLFLRPADGALEASASAATATSTKSAVLMKESKYRGVFKMAIKGVKKPFVAKFWHGSKYLQLGTFGSEIEAAHAYDKAALMHYGKSAQLNFPHLHDSFVRPEEELSVCQQNPSAAMGISVTLSPVRPSSAEYYASPGRGRGRCRGRGRGRGRGKRSQESPNVHATDAHFEMKRRKMETNGSVMGSSSQKTLSVPVKRYLGVQVHRVYAHAQIRVNGKVVNLGTFSTAEDAAMAYDKAVLKYFGDPTGFSDAHPDEIVLNFPEKRDVLLKQLLEEEKEKRARQAKVGESSYASRSAQNAKYNLLITKLNAWRSKLQRSVKMIEASQRVQWGLHSMSRKSDEEEDSKHKNDAISVSSLVGMEIFGSGPTIKKEYTTRDQKLRHSNTEIQNAILLMIDELKIYAADAPADPLFQPPPQCAPILDLLSTSRYLKLISAINDLAHLKAKTNGKDPDSVVNGRFESKLRAVVDYRARLQMSSSNEKQKLARFMHDVESPGLNSQFPVMVGGDTFPANAELGLQTSKAFDLLRNAKYVKRKKLILKPDTQNNGGQIDSFMHVIQANEEMKDESVGSPGETDMATIADVKMKVTSAEEEQKEILKISAAIALAEAGKDEAGSAPEMVSKNAKLDNNKDIEEKSGTDADAVSQDTDMNEFIGTETNKVMDLLEATVDTTKTEEETRKDDKLETSKAEEEKIRIGKSKEDKAEAKKSEDESKASKSEKADTEQVGKSTGNNTKEEKHQEDLPFDNKAACFEHEPGTAMPDDGVNRKSTGDALSSSTVAVPGDDFEWEYCLAIRTIGNDEWRLLPLSSTAHVTSKFADDVFLTEEEVTEMEVSEEEACSSSMTEGKIAWMEHLRQLHFEEGQMRHHIQRETNRQHALEGIIKIEQDRLNEKLAVYRETMDKVDMEISLALKNHKRVSQDALLVRLMQHSFNPILGDLLDKCEEALLNCFRKLSIRFDDFAQEFEYYRTLLLSLIQSPGKEPTTGDEHASSIDAADLNLDDNSAVVKCENIARASADTISTISDALEPPDDSESFLTEESDDFDDLSNSCGLRQAYVTFYIGEMEALWRERSSSLEMVHAIQRSLLNYATEVATPPEKTTLLVETTLPSEASDSTDLHMKVEDMIPEKTRNESVVSAAEMENTSKTSPSKTRPYVAEGRAMDSRNETETGSNENTMQSVDARTKTHNTPDLATYEVETLEMKAASVSSKVSVKVEPQLAFKKFRREQELREAVESCLAQWQCIQWPKELNSAFLTPTSMAVSHQFSKVKSEPTTSQSLTGADEKNSEFDSPYSVMEELKRVMIDLTQDQVIPVSPLVKPTTLVMYHPVFINHQTPKNHPECPERMNRVVNILNSLAKKHQETVKLDRLSMSPEELCPPETTLLMVHSPTYLRQLKERSIEAGSQSASSPTASSPSSRALVFESDSGIREEAPKSEGRKKHGQPPLVGAFGAASLEQNGVELDTFVSSKSWDVARAAAGTVCLAVDRVVRKECHNAVCLVRPPGHHVGRHGRTENAPSSGFCLLNNVVIGATHARLYPWVRKVAVLDWDIHHGNGTEELLKDDPDAFFASIHLYSSGKYFPGTGKSCETGNRVNVALENTGAGSGSQAFRSALEWKVLPAMRAFRPDIIFISAGFDGHRDDILGGVAAVNNPNVPAGYVEEDFAWATLEVLKLAAEVCDGRVVSVLEGGYDVRWETNSLAKSVAAHVTAISAYEAARRKKADNFTADVETKESKESKESTHDTATLASASIHDSSIKMEHFTEKKRVSLLKKLLSPDITDANVIMIDDEENEEESDGEGTHEMHDNDDIEDEEDTGEEDGDVGMEEAAQSDSKELHDGVEKRGQGTHSAMELDDR